MKQDKINITQNEMKDKISKRIAGVILQSQRSITNMFRLHTFRWRKKQQVVFLLLTCLLFGGTSMIVMIDCLRIRQLSPSVAPIPIFPVKGAYNNEIRLLITDNEFKAVQDYKLKHPELLMDRVGLCDSLQLIEQLFQSQKNK